MTYRNIETEARRQIEALTAALGRPPEGLRLYIGKLQIATVENHWRSTEQWAKIGALAAFPYRPPTLLGADLYRVDDQDHLRVSGL
jgi:hypothetical protein